MRLKNNGTRPVYVALNNGGTEAIDPGQTSSELDHGEASYALANNRGSLDPVEGDVITGDADLVRLGLEQPPAVAVSQPINPPQAREGYTGEALVQVPVEGEAQVSVSGVGVVQGEPVTIGPVPTGDPAAPGAYAVPEKLTGDALAAKLAEYELDASGSADEKRARVAAHEATLTPA